MPKGVDLGMHIFPGITIPRGYFVEAHASWLPEVVKICKVEDNVHIQPAALARHTKQLHVTLNDDELCQLVSNFGQKPFSSVELHEWVRQRANETQHRFEVFIRRNHRETMPPLLFKVVAVALCRGTFPDLQCNSGYSEGGGGV